MKKMLARSLAGAVLSVGALTLVQAPAQAAPETMRFLYGDADRGYTYRSNLGFTATYSQWRGHSFTYGCLCYVHPR